MSCQALRTLSAKALANWLGETARPLYMIGFAQPIHQGEQGGGCDIHTYCSKHAVLLTEVY
jgi:hypothetical protein